MATTRDGLPRAMFDVGFWRGSPKWEGATPAAIGLFVACLSHSTEHGSDGFVSSSKYLGTTLGLPSKAVRAPLRFLLQRDILRDHGDRLEIVGYLDHNRSAAQVREERERKSAAGREAAARRWNGSTHGSPIPGAMQREGVEGVVPSHVPNASVTNGTTAYTNTRTRERCATHPGIRGIDCDCAP